MAEGPWGSEPPLVRSTFPALSGLTVADSSVDAGQHSERVCAMWD